MRCAGPITRRTFERAKDSEPEAVAEALALIGAMYAHEKQIRADAFTGEDKRAYGDSLLAGRSHHRESGLRLPVVGGAVCEAQSFGSAPGECERPTRSALRSGGSNGREEDTVALTGMNRSVGRPNWHAGQRGERDTRRREGVADALLELDIGTIEFGAKLGGAAQIGAGRENAEAATEPRHAGGIGPVRRLAGLADDAEPRPPSPGRGWVASRTTHGLPGCCAPFAARRRASRPRGTLGGTHPHRVDEAPSVTRMSFQKVAKLAFDGRTFHVAGAVPSTRIRKAPTPLECVRAGIARMRYVRE